MQDKKAQDQLLRDEAMSQRRLVRVLCHGTAQQGEEVDGHWAHPSRCASAGPYLLMYRNRRTPGAAAAH